MLFSQMCKAAIKSVIYIATFNDDQTFVTIKNIAGHVEENEHTIGKILQLLSKQGIIKSMKGANGGFYITEVQRQIPIQKIVQLIDGHGVLDQCVLGLNQCNAKKPCPLHDEYVKAKIVIQNILTKNTINEFAELVNKGEFNLVN